MKLGCETRRWAITVAVLGIVWLAIPSAHAADSLMWSKDKNSVDADVSSWSLIETLEKVGEATGWEIYLEPGTKRIVSTKFKNRPRDIALDFLLGDLGRVLLPQTNGQPAKLLVFRSSQKEATQLVSKPKEKEEDSTKNPIPTELIVTLKPGESIDELAKKLGAKVLGRNDELNTYRLEFESAEAAKAARSELAQNPAVESIDNNYYVRRPETLDNADFMNQGGINLEPLAPSCTSGSHPTIGLIDAAVQKTGAAYESLILPSVDVAGKSPVNANLPTHGTGMVQAMLHALSQKQKQTEWRIRPYNVWGPNEKANTFDVANGISKAITDGANPINLSLGTEGDSSFLHRVIQSGHKQGITFFGAAGNEPLTTPTYPGAYPEVIAVTAGNADGRVAPYANRGEFVDILAPDQARITFNGQTYITTGTSVSTAFVSGIAAGSVNGGCVTGDQLRAGLQSMMRAPAK